jgi:hypothetical protein
LLPNRAFYLNFMKNSFLILTFISLYYSCNFSGKSEGDGYLTLTDSLTIQITTDIEPYTYTMQYKEGFIYWWNQNRQTISRFNIEKGISEDFLKYEYEGPNGIGDPMGFYIHNEDSIYLPKKNTHNVNLLNRSGELLNVFNYYNENIDIYPAISYSTFGMQFRAYENRLILLNQNYNPYTLDPASKLKEYYPFFEINMNNGKSHVLNFQFGNNIIDKLAVGFGSAYMIKGNKLYSKHHDSRYLYIFDLENNTSEEIFLKSNLLTNFSNEYLIGTNQMDIETFQRKFYKSAQIFGFTYDSFQKVFYEFGWPGDELNASNRPITNISRFLPYFVINIYNQKLELIGEHTVPSNTYLPHLYFVDQRGLNLFATHPDNPNNVDENKISIHTYSFSPN